MLALGPLCLLSLASALPQPQSASGDEWLAVINGKSEALEETQDVDYYQFQDNRRAPPAPIQTSISDTRRVGVAPPPVQQSQSQQRQSGPPPPRAPPLRRQQPPGQPPRSPGQPLRGPPPAIRRPLPKKKEPGLLDTVVNGVNSVLNPVASGVTCAATNLIADEKLKDEAFIRSQMDCAMGRGPCDEVGKKIKFLAPEVLAGRCPAPCNPCIKDQIRKVMSQLSQKYPREFQQMMASLTRRG